VVYGVPPFLPTTREENLAALWLGQLRVHHVSGDAMGSIPSFGMAVTRGRLLEAQGYRVGSLNQPDWGNSRRISCALSPHLYFGHLPAGNMDLLIKPLLPADLNVRN